MIPAHKIFVVFLLLLSFSVHAQDRESKDMSYQEYYELANDALKEKNYGEAEFLFDSVIVLKPDYAKAYEGKGEALYNKGYQDAALECYNKALKLDSLLASVYILKGWYYHRKGLHTDASYNFDRAVKIEPNKAKIYIARSDFYLMEGEYKKALPGYEKYYNTGIRHEGLNINYAMALDGTKNTRKAIEILEENIKNYPSSSNSHRDLASYYFNIEDTINARKHYDIAIKINPNKITYYKSKGEFLFKIKEWDNALKVYDKMILLDKYSSIAYLYKSTIYQNLKQYKKAADELEKILKFDRGTPEIYNNLGNLRYIMKDEQGTLDAYNDAIKLLEKDMDRCMIDANTRDYITSQSQMGKAYKATNRWQQAIDNYLPSLHQDNYWQTTELAFCYLALNDTDNALKYFKMSESVKTDYTKTLLGLSMTYFLTGDNQNLLDILDRISPERIKEAIEENPQLFTDNEMDILKKMWDETKNKHRTTFRPPIYI